MTHAHGARPWGCIETHICTDEEEAFSAHPIKLFLLSGKTRLLPWGGGVDGLVPC